ncbi:MAG: dihydrodipicolinate synthase family protein [Devosia sp.]
MTSPRGIFPMLYTFFDAHNRLDRTAFRRQVEVCIGSGCSGIAILGLIGEVKALSVAERETLVHWAVEDIAGRVPLMATIAGVNLDDVRRLSASAEAAGASYLILQPPIGQRLDSSELLAFYSAAMASIRTDVGIQNAPEFLGVGLSRAEVADLRRRHANFTLMKGEGPVVHVKPFIDSLGRDLVVFNGRGGLELPDNLLAGCAGMIPAPDCADVQIGIFRAFEAGDMQTVERLYANALPYIVFAMQSLDIAIFYGKRMFARRASIDNSGACRVPTLSFDPFFEAALTRWSARFGAYGSTS